MKKLFTLCAALLLLGTGVSAQTSVDETFLFVDANDNVVADGSVIVVNKLNEFGQMVIPLKVKNMSGEKAAVSMYETIDAMPNGEWQTCAFGNCMQLTATGYSPKNIMVANYNADIQTEWMPVADSYATWEATLQIHVFNIVKQTKFGVTTEVPGDEIIGYGPTVTVRFEYTKQSASQTQQVWWGYVSENDNYAGLGTKQAETYDCASFYAGNNPIVAGKTINAVRFALPSKNIKDVKVWLAESLPTTLGEKNIVRLINVEKFSEGINVVTLPTPYTAGKRGIYVGYSFTVTKLQVQEDYYPIAIAGSSHENALWLRTSTSMTTWDDFGYDYGCLYLQLQLEGEFLNNAVSFASTDLGESVAVIGGTAIAYVPLFNQGTEELHSIDYTITADGTTGAEQHLDLASPIAFGSTSIINLQVSADDVAGTKEKTITITKVNGTTNEVGTVSTTYQMTTVSKTVPHGVAVEEFTGTQCGYCPRGIAGMEKLRRKYGDKFVGLAVHGYANSTSQDAMYLANWGSNYAKIFSGSAPACQLNRAYGEIDPYYGTYSDICTDFENELNIPAKVGITLNGEWNADSTKVNATAILEAVIPGQQFTIEYALIADSLTGTSTAWNQSNYYYNTTSSDPDIALFCRNGKYGQSTIKGWVFNDAVIATCYKSGKNQTTAPGTLAFEEPVTNTYTLTMPTNTTLLKAITKERVAVVALVIDSNGIVVNAAKFYMPGYNGESAINGVTVKDKGQNVRYSLDGRQLQTPQKGMNIVRMADGSVRKVMVK